MSRCENYEGPIERLLADEIDDAERDRLLAHAESCSDCRQFVELHHRLMGPELDPELPSDAELAAVRRTVMRTIRAERRTARGSFFDELSGLLRLLVATPAGAAAAAALMLVALGLGVVGGRSLGQSLDDPIPSSGADGLLAQIRTEALSHRLLADVENSPYLYSNVSFSDNENGSLKLSFDVTRHMELQRPQSDPLVNEILAQALLSPSPLGTRLEAITYAGARPDPKLKQALAYSMLNDRSLAVRLRALSILSDYGRNPKIQEALLAVLRGEQSVQMRMLAMDTLAAADLSPERVARVQEEVGRQNDRAVLLRASSLGLLPASTTTDLQ